MGFDLGQELAVAIAFRVLQETAAIPDGLFHAGRSQPKATDPERFCGHGRLQPGTRIGGLNNYPRKLPGDGIELGEERFNVG